MAGLSWSQKAERRSSGQPASLGRLPRGEGARGQSEMDQRELSRLRNLQEALGEGEGSS